MSRRKSSHSEQGGPKVPAYIVTFSDMVTLLLTFFVMLLSLAHTQDPELFNAGRDSFVKSIRGFGLGMLLGKDQSIDFENPKIKYTIENPEDSQQKRTIDAKEERTRRLFEELRESAKTMPGNITTVRCDFPITEVHFAPGSSELNSAGKQSISDLCDKLYRDLDPKPQQLYVLGLSDEGTSDKQQWKLSALRAKTVAELVEQSFPKQDRPAVYSWGAGPGKMWNKNTNSIPKGCQVVIAVLR
ncbi:MAG: flagellar motor protein MotB [Phycisphaerae bacterium]